MLANVIASANDLRALADAVNAFKSEAVQLRVLELLFQSAGMPARTEPSQGEDINPISTPPKRRKKTKPRPDNAVAGSDTPSEKIAPKSKRGTLGPKAMLESLISEGYFDQARRSPDILKYCSDKKAVAYQPGEISVTLTRLTRENKLDREKNGEGQYTYTRKH